MDKECRKKSVKGQFVANFIKETNKVFSLHSESDAAEIIDIWAKTSNYTKPFLDSIRGELTNWAKKYKAYEKDISADMGETLLDGSIGAVIGGAGGAGIGGLGGVIAGAGAAAGGGAAAGIGTAAVAAEAAPLLAGAVGAGAAGGGAAAGAGVVAGAGAIALAPLVAFAALTGAVILGVGGAYYGYHSSKERKLNKKVLEELKKSAKQKRKWDVYSRALENIMNLIENNAWIDNDLLRAELNYEKDLQYARANFIKVGISVPKNVTMVFQNLSTALSSIREKLKNSSANYNNKEEL